MVHNFDYNINSDIKADEQQHETINCEPSSMVSLSYDYEDDKEEEDVEDAVEDYEIEDGTPDEGEDADKGRLWQ